MNTEKQKCTNSTSSKQSNYCWSRPYNEN